MSENSNTYPLADELYHYTTNKALLSIITNKEIWLSDVRFLNDREEFIFSKSIMKTIVDQLNLDRWLGKLSAANLPPEYTDQMRKDFERFESGFYGPAFDLALGYITCVFCLSEERDSLAQWRGYGNQEVCIGFNPKSFLKSPFDQKSLGKVRYFDRGEIDVEMLDFVHSMLDEYIDRKISDYSSSIHRPQSGSSMFLGKINPNEALFIKHSGFKSENEWRVIVRKPACGLPSTDFYFLRESSTIPIPTFRQPINIIDDISSITFGPGADEALVRVLEDILIYKGAPGPRWRIRKSSIPYRG